MASRKKAPGGARRKSGESRRYLGLNLAGARNQKTTLATLEHYPREGKIFLLEIDEGIGPNEDTGSGGDAALLELIAESGKNVAALGVDVPLTLPPCLTCESTKCGPRTCPNPSVKWMRESLRKARKRADADETFPRPREFTAYTQRPVELWIRYEVLPKLDPRMRFDVDETLGGNRAPLTARMCYLKRHLRKFNLVEVLPKLTMSMLVEHHDLPRRLYLTYRHLEQGAHSRSLILEELTEKAGLFIYERDMKKLAKSLSAFDALISAYTALLSDTGRCAKIPKGFPARSGWIDYPQI